MFSSPVTRDKGPIMHETYTYGPCGADPHPDRVPVLSPSHDEETDVMRKSRFSEQQIIAVLKEHEAGLATAEVS